MYVSFFSSHFPKNNCPKIKDNLGKSFFKTQSSVDKTLEKLGTKELKLYRRRGFFRKKTTHTPKTAKKTI